MSSIDIITEKNPGSSSFKDGFGTVKKQLFCTSVPFDPSIPRVSSATRVIACLRQGPTLVLVSLHTQHDKAYRK